MSTRPLPLVFLLLAAAGCSQKLQAAGCRSDGQCPANARCQSGVCAADGPPVATLRPIGTVAAYALVPLDGSASRDPDDTIAEHAWTIRALDARCAPPEVATNAPLASVRFGCAGRFEVSLTVRDELGVESEPATQEVNVVPAAGEPVVAASPDAAAEHVCRGSPLRCRTERAIQLAASAPAGLALRWSVEPPVERPLDASRRVRFVPDAASAEPFVEIETDGTAISGDWIFRVEALDACGVVGAALTRVSVRNRAPVVTFEPAGPFPHAFDAGRSVFTSEGALHWSVVDPDGDPVQLTAVWRHVGDGGESTFDGELAGTTATFAVEVPYDVPADALRLRGGDELARRIEILALDANRALGRGAGEVEIGNRPPVAAGGSFDKVVPHRFDGARSSYVAMVRAGSFVDPDGDPLLDSTGPGLCGTIHVDGNDATVECAVPFEGVPAVERLAGTRTFTVPVRDPWDAATSVPVRTVEILNTPPVLSGAPSLATVSATFWMEPKAFFSGCPWRYAVSGSAFDVVPDPSDPDGDPVLVTVRQSAGGSASPDAAVCRGPGCVTFHVVEAPHELVCTPDPYAVTFLEATDGAAQVELGVSPRPTS